jgi:hypothetical protein
MKMYVLSTYFKNDDTTLFFLTCLHKRMIQYYFIKRAMTKIILSTIFQLSPYIEYVNLLLNFCTTHMSSQINGVFIRFAKKKEIVERMMCNTSLIKKMWLIYYIY